MRILPVLLLLLCSLPATPQSRYCTADRFSETALFDSSEIRVDSNIVFATVKNYFTNVNATLGMDVFYPDMSVDTFSERPFILLIHGGSFMAGSRKDMGYKCMELARRGFVTATIDYRLGWSCGGTDFLSICIACGGLNNNLKTATYSAVQDARAALRYIHANAPAYKIDTAWMFTGGESAGAITALHATFWTQADANAFNAAAVSQVGLLDTAGNSLASTYSIKGVINSCGAVTKDSIVFNKGPIPVINFADEYDCIVPPGYGQVISCACQSFYYDAGAAAIYARLTQSGICSEYHQVPASLNHCSFPSLPLVNKAACFLKRVMCNTCQSAFSSQPGAPVACSLLSALNGLHTELDLDFTNPVKNTLELPFKNKLQIRVTDILGNLVLQSSNITGASINTTHWPEGIYILTATDGKLSRTKKFVVLK